ncbi:MAG TPA: hypothetical protein VLG49_00295 [Rhabdochlamydiaceae bacterium]|nr:hypothetical protein [Rhabdochlamydiaceae bacterium]
MSNNDKDTKNFVLGAVIGAAVGIGTIAILHAVRCHKKGGSLHAVGETLAHVGESVKHHLEDPEGTLREFDRKIEKNEDTIVDILDWTAMGIQLWNKLKKR